MANETSQGLSYLLDEVVSAVFFESFFEEAALHPTLFNVRPSGRRRERLASTTGLTSWDVKQPGAEVTPDASENAYEKDFVHTAYAKQVNVERELLDDQEFGILQQRATEMGQTAMYTIEEACAQLFLDATTGNNHLAEDSAAICSAHTAKDGVTTITNNGTSALSLASIKSTRTAMRKYTNHRGDLMSVRPNALLVPPDLEETAWEIVNSVGRPDTAERADNFYRSGWTLYVWDFLSAAISNGDDDQWFMLDMRGLMRNLMLFMRVPMEIFGDGNLFAGNRRIGGYMRWSLGIRDYRHIFCQKPA